jgi:signal transduction histidine kinase/DNA-binding response OmpR family regulator/streptogramin lyase
MIFVLQVAHLSAQVVEPKFETFSATIVHAFHHDSQGFIWIGSQEGLLRFDGYTYKPYSYTPFDSNSLSNDWVFDIEEDHLGNLWIGTFGGGLNYFDQKTEKFTRFSGTTEKNQNSHITKIIVNEDGSIWFSGSMHSLTHLKLDLDKKPHYTHYDFSNEPVAKSFPTKNTALTAHKDKQGIIWIGMATEGLIRFDPVTEEIIQYKHDPENNQSISHNTISSICEDDSGNIWIGTGHPNISRHGAGLNLFNRRTKTFKHFKHDWSGKNSICSNNICQLLIDNTGIMWIGTWNNYINTVAVKELLSEEEPFFRHHKNLKRPVIESLYEDRYGNVWIGLMNRESHKFDRQQNSFALFSRNENYPNSLTQTGTWTVYADQSGKMWFGTNGVDVYDSETGNFKHYYYDRQDTTGLSSNMISGIQENPEGNVWIATWHDGINILIPESGIFKHMKNNPNDSMGLGSNTIQHLLARPNGDFWIATQNVGIQLYERKTGNFYTFDLDPETHEDFIFSNLCEDRSGTLWIGTSNNGMYSLRLDKHLNPEIVHYYNDPQNLSSLSCNDVSDIIQPSVIDTNTLWIATKAGLNRFDLETKSFKHFYRKDGLAANLILKILEDNQGNLWCTTPHGISVYNIKTGKILSFGRGDGMPFDSFGGFRQNAAKDLDGRLYFAGGNGVLSFLPEDIRQNPNIPPIRITDFSVFPKHVELDTAIQYKRSIVLDYNQNMFSFDFAALNFTNPEKNQYAYKMEGLIDDWIQIGTERTASFTNLDPGEYVFRVKGSNNHGVWNEEGTSVKVIILPPWWRSSWAYIAYFILVLSVLYALRQYDLKRQRLKHQLALEHEYTENLQEIDRMKSRFFANISHEFRTPLTLILGPIKKWLPQLRNRNLKQDLMMMQRNANRLFRLINQLLDLSRLESGGMTLQVREADITQMLRGYVQSFESLARIKKINLEFIAEPESIKTFVDRDKIEKIMYNLLSNAFKFTPENGEVIVCLSLRGDLHKGRSTKQSPSVGNKEIAASSPLLGTRNDKSKIQNPKSKFLKISVTNTGSYIPPENINRIFDRFYQANVSEIRGHEGSGIGLALTKELVELHHGQIRVDSHIDTGTIFTIHLPLGKEHLNEQQISDSPISFPDNIEEAFLYETMTAGESRPKNRKNLPLVMIVEDNPDVRFYIRGHLEHSFRIAESSDGKEGLETAIKKIPDLIISDVMMPGMDGFELCRKLKTDERTSHIPVILLTARATTEDKIGGLETGADDYLTKPFDAQELQARIRNLIKQREKLRAHYARHLKFDQQLQTGNIANHAFHDRAIQVVERHLADEEFDVTDFAREMDYSRSQLTRKLEALTGMAPSRFIRMQRLVQASKMLGHEEVNISQVAYACGFNNLSYFSRSFKAQFGQLPSDYIKKNN